MTKQRGININWYEMCANLYREGDFLEGVDYNYFHHLFLNYLSMRDISASVSRGSPRANHIESNELNNGHTCQYCIPIERHPIKKNCTTNTYEDDW